MSAYWEGRMIARQRIYDRAVDETIAILYAAYNRASRQIGEDILTIFDQFRGMYGLSTEDAKKLLSAHAPQEILEMLRARVAKMPNSARKNQLMARLSAPAYAARITRLQAMEESARVALAQVANIEIKADTKALEKAAETAYMRTMFDVQQYSGLMFPVAGVSEKRLSEVLRNQWIGANYSVRVWRNTEETARLTAQALEEMLLSGKASHETFRDIMKAAITKDGISPEQRIAQGKMAANRLLRTEYNYVTGQADMDAYEEAGFDRYRYVAVLDGRTSTVCRDLDGQVFPLKDQKIGVNMHPMHPWCRSTTEPIFDDLVIENQTRWARDPVTGEEMHVPRDMTYREWKKKMEELHGKEALSAAEKKRRNEASDREQWEKYRSRMGKKNVPDTVEDFQEMKYNIIDKYTSLKKSYRTIGEIQSKPWSDIFKEKAVDVYFIAKEQGVELSSHAVARFLDRANKKGHNTSMDDLLNIMGKKANYTQGEDRLIRFYDGIAIVTDRKSGDVITFVNRRTAKEDWGDNDE